MNALLTGIFERRSICAGGGPQLIQNCSAREDGLHDVGAVEVVHAVAAYDAPLPPQHDAARVRLEPAVSGRDGGGRGRGSEWWSAFERYPRWAMDSFRDSKQIGVRKKERRKSLPLQTTPSPITKQSKQTKQQPYEQESKKQ